MSTMTDEDRQLIGKHKRAIRRWMLVLVVTTVLFVFDPLGLRWLAGWIGPLPLMAMIWNAEWIDGYETGRGLKRWPERFWDRIGGVR